VSDKKVIRSSDSASTRTKAILVKNPKVIVNRSRECSDSHLRNKSSASEWWREIMNRRSLYFQRLHREADQLFPDCAEGDR